ncbi:dimethylaniline monooxygenase [Aspergillus sclerotiicarbonarius CBS 121057]|uniref:Dimethylaniline monooxygenase n=1 Tax=Aspergillus sclerotiicarbonarius (strain CBS 121057 / IBT 28362) TaxID=1448318 RepID=A0A319EHK6_ASPSB|nr:dimethylaniline monooxygenase [Aspergillus sclerotiicarbonarius CBS 121057]
MAQSKEVIIIGGGISGLGMAVQLKRLLGHDNFTIHEKSDNVGGTWWHNRYPACACDIPSHFYSYRFAIKPDWSTTYPGCDELHAYFLSVAEKYDIIPHCRFNKMCLDLTWDSTRSVWTCTFQDTISGEIFHREAPVVVSAIGTLDRPYIPEIEDADTFQGKMFHSARWDDTLKPEGKNIVVLGNGASATQFVPELVKKVGPNGSVTQFIRSAHWWTKRDNPKYSPLFKLIMKHIPLAARIYRLHLAWQLDRIFLSFQMTPKGASMRQTIRNTTTSYITQDAPPQYHQILTPNYEPGCKCRINTPTYLSCLHSPQMHLTNDQVLKIHPTHITTATGTHYPADTIIYATGFDTQQWLHPLTITSQNQNKTQTLHSLWTASHGASAYKGTVVTSFPNFFILYGPNSGTGQHSVIFHSECQINFTCRLLRPVLRDSARSIMVKPDAQRRDVEWVHEKLKGFVFNTGCRSWCFPISRISACPFFSC